MVSKVAEAHSKSTDDTVKTNAAATGSGGTQLAAGAVALAALNGGVKLSAPLTLSHFK